MKRIFTVGLVLALFLATAGCSRDRKAESSANPVRTAAASQSSPTAGKIFKTLSPRQAEDLITSRKDLLVVDVREPSELKEGYIKGSVLVPLSQLSRGEKTLPRRPLLIVCAIGGRSYAVARYYSYKGYPEIYSLEGGIANWKKDGLPLQY